MDDAATCDDIQLELSVAHDENRAPMAAAAAHAATCEACAGFDDGLRRLDSGLARGDVSLAPDVTGAVMAGIDRRRASWMGVAAVAAIGIALGAMAAGIGRLEAVQAQELEDHYHTASPSVLGLGAEVVVVERGWHPAVPERVYSGSLFYAAPEQLTIELSDTTEYPDQAWVPNDVAIGISEGNLVKSAALPCPVGSVPTCQQPQSTTAVRNLPPFDASVLLPLEIVAPAGSFTWWSGLEVIGSPTLEGEETIQVETTVAGAELIQTLIETGAWRELHPTDRVVMWLQAETLVPIRVEVFAADSPERELWQLRRGLTDAGEEPIFILALSDITTEIPDIEVDVPPEAPSGGFVDGPSRVPQPTLDPGFLPHRSGHWLLPEAQRVEVSSWSDGRSWIRLEATEGWTKSELFGLPTPFVQRIDLGPGAVGYLDSGGETIAIHTDALDVAVSGSVPRETLIQVAASLDLVGVRVPDGWPAATILGAGEMPEGTLIPAVEGWSILGRALADRREIVMTGSGSRAVSIISQPGEALDPPAGPDVVGVEVRGLAGRFDGATGTLEWIEEGLHHQVRSQTVGRDELLALAEAMAPR